MPKTNWADMKKSGDKRRNVSTTKFDIPNEATRDDLNTLAREYGIEHPEDLPNKAAVIEAIRNA